MIYTSIQDRVDETVDLVMDLLNKKNRTEEEETEAIESIKDLGHQWQQANAHGHALTVAAGIMAGETFDPDSATMEDLKRIEVAGTRAIFEAVSIAVYTGIVMAFMPRPDWADDDDD